MATISNIDIEDAQFVYRPNFEGRRETYNDEGNRFFNLLIPDDMVSVLRKDGWNVKITKPSKSHPNPEEFEPQAFLEVTVGFNYRPPEITLYKGRSITELNEDTVDILDVIDIETFDVSVRPYSWSQPDGSSGIKAYLDTMAVVVPTNRISEKWAKIREEEYNDG